MKRTIAACVRQAVCSPRFVIGAAVVAAAVFLAGTDSIITAFRGDGLLSFGWHGQLVADALSSDGLAFILPIVCTLPYTASYVDDIKTGFLRQFAYRTGSRSYVLGKAAGCVVSGGLAVLAGILLAYGLAAAVFLPMEAAREEEAVRCPHMAEILTLCVTFFLSGGLWAMVGMALSAAMESRYVAYASPFIFYYILIILQERYLEGVYIIDPRQWMAGGTAWPMGMWGMALILLQLTAAAVLCFYVLAKRRLLQL